MNSLSSTLIDWLENLRHFVTVDYLVGEGLDVGVPTGKRSQDASKREQIFAQRQGL